MWRYRRISFLHLGTLHIDSVYAYEAGTRLVTWPVKTEPDYFSVHTMRTDGTVLYNPKLYIPWWYIKLPTGDPISVRDALELPYYKREEYGVEIP